jgi:luciferase family oxidoreductase group 1
MAALVSSNRFDYAAGPVTNRPHMTIFSVLDLSPITEGSDASQALANTLDLARHAEALGYHRYWVAEHHNMQGIASAATAVVIGHIAQGTSSIRVGSGGVMLPNHAPLVIAEQFGTLESLFPGRIDLGLGRAPGTDQVTAQALRRNLDGDVNAFPQDVVELQHYFSEPVDGQRVRAVPGAGLHVPIWILGSSLFGAQLAAALGLPFGFASHFAPGALTQALEIYRERFEPSEQLQEPYVMVGYNICAAATEDEAQYLRSSSQQSFLNMSRGQPRRLQPPVRDFLSTLSPADQQALKQMPPVSAVGEPDTVRDQIKAFVTQTGADEVILACQVHEHAARVESYRLTAQALGMNAEERDAISGQS